MGWIDGVHGVDGVGKSVLERSIEKWVLEQESKRAVRMMVLEGGWETMEAMRAVVKRGG